MENGDDIVVSGPGIDRAEGLLGFDWMSFQNDSFGVNIDLDLDVFPRPSQVGVRRPAPSSVRLPQIRRRIA